MIAEKENERVEARRTDTTAASKGMSVEAIRARMAMLNTGGISSPASGNENSSAAKPSKPKASPAAAPPPSAAGAVPPGELAVLTDEILIFCHLLDSSRRRAIDECITLRQTIKELEKLLDSARLREVNHLSYVEQQREILALFYKRYSGLKSRARNLVKEVQEEKEKLKVEAEELSRKYKDAETNLYSCQSLLDEQSKELERLREKSRNGPSEKEIQNMQLRVFKLEDENGKLATERAQLMAQLDDYQSGKGGKTTRTDAKSKREEDLEHQVRHLTEKNKALSEKLQANERQTAELQEYIAILLEKVDD